MSFFVAALALSASAMMMERSGLNDTMGMSCGSLDGSQVGTIDVPDFGGNSIADLSVDLLSSFGDFIVLGPLDRAAACIGFPGWVSTTVINLVIRPLYAIAAVQLGRGVVIE